jgi:hypothetical protein
VTEHVKVEITRRVVPADEATLARRAEVVERMRLLGHLDADAEGSVGELMDGGWTAQINGVVFPVVTYGVEPGGEGSIALVSLLIPASAVSIVGHAATPTTTPPPVPPAAPEAKPVMSTWGAKAPDPRESIPGWKPEPDSVHLTHVVDFSPGSGDRIVGHVREHIRRTTGGSAVNA